MEQTLDSIDMDSDVILRDGDMEYVADETDMQHAGEQSTAFDIDADVSSEQGNNSDPQLRYRPRNQRLDRRFDLERALNFMLRHNPEAQDVYRPYTFAQTFGKIIGQNVQAKLKINSFVDGDGHEWRRVHETELLEVNLGDHVSVFQEMHELREICWLIKLQDKVGEFEAVPKLYRHGWKDNKSIVYCRVVERPEANLYDLVMSGS